MTTPARLIREAGASALELNSFFVPVDAALDGRAVEQRHLDVLRAVKGVVTLPIAVKLSPHFSAIGDLVRQLDQAGANGFVLFNRFYQPDIDLLTMRLSRSLDLSTPDGDPAAVVVDRRARRAGARRARRGDWRRERG